MTSPAPIFALLLGGSLSLAGTVQGPPGVPPCPAASDAPDLSALLRRTEQVLEGSSSVAVMTMTITTPRWTRSLKMKVWAKGRDFALVRILEGGPRETGMLTLKRDKQLWTYLPQAGRVMKLPSGMLGDSWMGSDLTNDDLVKGSSVTKDFTATVTGTHPHEGRSVWRLTLTPRKEAVVVWGRVDLVVDRETCLPLEQRFFDDEGKLARSMAFTELRQAGWRRYPSRFTVRPAEEGRHTAVTYETIEYDVDIPDDTFSLHRLQQGR